MAEWTDSYITLAVVCLLSWQIIGGKVLEYVQVLLADKSTPLERYIVNVGSRICSVEQPVALERAHIENDLILRNARLIDGDGVEKGIMDVFIKDGKIKAVKRPPKSRELVVWTESQDMSGSLHGRYITPGLIDPFGIEQDAVTTRIVHENGYGSAMKNNDELLVPNGWVRSPEDVSQLEQVHKMWVEQALWCKEFQKNGKNVDKAPPEHDTYQHWIDALNGHLKLLDDGLGGQDLLFQAQLKHHYGVTPEEAIASVTGNMADKLGLSSLGYIRAGYDADIVVWDKHPLILGAAPEEVYIDGQPQLGLPLRISHVEELPALARRNETVRQQVELKDFAITGIRESHVQHPTARALRPQDRLQLVVHGGNVVCYAMDCRRHITGKIFQLHLDTAYLLPGTVAVGEIGVLNSTTAIQSIEPARARDGLVYTSEITRAYHSGIEYAISIPYEVEGFFRGFSACFSTSSGEVLDDHVALHVSLKEPSPHKMSWLRFYAERYNDTIIAVHTDSRDVMERLIELKHEMGVQFVIIGGGQAHDIANNLASEEIPVILTHFSTQMGQLSNLNILHSAGVRLGFSQAIENIHFRAGLAAAQSGISRNEMLDMLSWNIFDIFNIQVPSLLSFVVTEGFGLQTGSQVSAIVQDGVLKVVWL